MESENKKYRIKDRQTGNMVGGLYVTQRRARRRVDRLDNAYGAYRYSVVEVAGEQPILNNTFNK